MQQHEQPAAAGADASAAAPHIPPVAEWGKDPFLMSGCEASAAPLRVAVLVSGGVDSSLALQLVAAAGHKPTAFYLQIWFQEDFRNFWDACPWEEDLDYAKKVCDALGVPLVVVPLTDAYWQRVVSHSVAEIKEGRTPNPDMLCNSRVKFGAFVEYLEREHGGSFDRIASGHYACIQRPQQLQQQQHSLAPDGVPSDHQADTQQLQQQQQQHSLAPDGVPSDHQADTQQLQGRLGSHAQASSSSSSSSSGVVLRLTPDAVKDQTYFLANLSAGQLARCMFPLGPFTKPQVRALATAAGLATSGRKDSQGICFLGKVKFGEFVGQHLGQWPGPLVEEDSGQVVGVHKGYWFYTVGQRGGIKLPGGPWYVTAKDMTHNVVYVSRSYYEQHKRRDAFVCGPFNWLSELRPDPSQPLLVKVRHGPNMYSCSLQLGLQEDILAHAESAIDSKASSDSAAGADEQADSSSSSSTGSSGSHKSIEQQHQQQQQQQQGPSFSGEGSYGLVVLCENDQGLAAGQYAVFYQQGACLGSAQMLGSVAR
ncbi:hypothetical protein OEZ85_012328 [Tetradesmus obliquus]|uniref:tRNA-5-taurinomethyluridine 2-sulfurtransferase n=1 Tax=Tetradesmus obliquus TaxID=3088 RepID=A0ABY8TT10_TETOB|nr:hypothetical protein OEZ85_012328 [Tetradesmus obliquus]